MDDKIKQLETMAKEADDFSKSNLTHEEEFNKYSRELAIMKRDFAAVKAETLRTVIKLLRS